MRRIYESSALDRDDDDPYRPNERDRETKPRAARTVPVAGLSKALVPDWVVRRGISVDLAVPDRVFEQGERVPLRVELRNAFPFPVVVRTHAPVLWTWHVDGRREASMAPEPLPDRSESFVFDRGERKRFTRRWHGSVHLGSNEWTEAEPGEHTVSVRLAVENADADGLSDEATIRIE